MTLQESISTCFIKYTDFSGRASRSEYWWFVLIVALVGVALDQFSVTLTVLFRLATLLPWLAAGSRRLHDTNRSGLLQLLWLLPVIGWIILIVFLAQEGRASESAET